MTIIRLFALLFALVFMVLLGRLFTMQVVQHDTWLEQEAFKQASMRLVPYQRGSIVTRDGTVLAQDVTKIKLTTTLGKLYPEYTGLMLLLDGLQLISPDQIALSSKTDFPDKAALNDRTEKVLENFGLLLDRWHQSEGTIWVRLSRGLLRRYELRDVLPEEAEFSFKYRVQPGCPGVPADFHELWLALPPDCPHTAHAVAGWLSEIRKPQWQKQWPNLMPFLEKVGRHILRRADAGSEAAFHALMMAMDSDFAVEKEVWLLKDLDERAHPRLNRYVYLRRAYFPGIRVRTNEDGPFYQKTRTYDVSLRCPLNDAYQETLHFLSGQGYGSHALGQAFAQNARLDWRNLKDQDGLLAKFKGQLIRANREYLSLYRQKCRKYDFDIAWEIAQAGRRRYLENHLFSVPFPVINDLGRYGAVASRLLTLLPAHTPLRIQKYHARQYRSDENGVVSASLVGMAKPWENVDTRWLKGDRENASKSGKEEYLATLDYLQSLWHQTYQHRHLSMEALFRQRRNNASPPFALRLNNELLGVSGLEAALDEGLQGFMGLDAKLNGATCFVAPFQGHAVRLTIDLDLSRAMYRALEKGVNPFRGESGFGLVMDLHNGDMLAMVSYPGYDPQRYMSGDAAYLERLHNYPSTVAPMRNHCLQTVMPGSIFKLFVAATYLDLYPQISTAKVHTLQYNIKKSNNEPFIEMGAKRIGMARFANQLATCGFNDKTYGLNALVTGSLPAVKSKPHDVSFLKRYQNFHDICIGSGETSILPLAMLRYVGAIACGGTVPRPRLITRASVSQDRLIQRSKTCAIIRKGMWQVVHDGGTASGSELNTFNVAAKTGTAVIKVDKIQNALLVGFFPFDKPRFAFMACLERVAHGTHGGDADSVAPVVKAALDCLHKKHPGLQIRKADQ